MSNIIAFTGKARSGKDTSCSIVKNILEDEYGYNVEVMAYADNLKLSASKIFDLTWNDLYGETKETPQVFDLSYPELMFKVTEAMESTFRDERYHMDFKLMSELTGRLIMELKKVAKPTLLTRLGFSKKYKFSSRLKLSVKLWVTNSGLKTSKSEWQISLTFAHLRINTVLF